MNLRVIPTDKGIASASPKNIEGLAEDNHVETRETSQNYDHDMREV